MGDNGKVESQEMIEPGRATMGRRTRQPLFERELIQPGMDVLSAVTMTHFEDQQEVVNTAKYINHMLMFNSKHKFDDRIEAALIKINGLRSIKSRSTKYSVQAHGGLFWDSDASKEDKQYLSKLQEKERRQQVEEGGGGERR